MRMTHCAQSRDPMAHSTAQGKGVLGEVMRHFYFIPQILISQWFPAQRMVRIRPILGRDDILI